MKRGIRIMAGAGTVLAALLGTAALAAADWGPKEPGPIDVRDSWLQAWIAMTPTIRQPRRNRASITA